MPCRPSARLAVIVGAGLVLAAATYAEAGSRFRGHHGLRRSSNFHQRFYQARSDLHSRSPSFPILAPSNGSAGRCSTW